ELPDRKSSVLDDRLRGISDGFDGHIRIEETYDAAGAALQPFIAPGKCAYHATFPEHHFDVAAEILRVQQPFLEGPAVKGKHVLPNFAPRLFVGEFKSAKKFRRRSAVLLRELVGKIGPHAADRRVHCMIAGAA